MIRSITGVTKEGKEIDIKEGQIVDCVSITIKETLTKEEFINMKKKNPLAEALKKYPKAHLPDIECWLCDIIGLTTESV